MRRTKKQQKNKSRNLKGKKWPQQQATASTLSGPRISPDELDVKLQYADLVRLTNGGGGLASKSYQINAAYDVDPSLGSTETYGFDEYAALYSYYRVIGCSYQISVVNFEAFPVNTYVLLANHNPATVGSNFLLFSSNPYCKHKLLAVSPGTHEHVFRGGISFSRLLGSNNVETADSFRALTTAIPADILWLTIAGENPVSGTMANGCVFDVRITMHVRFYGREVDLTLAGMFSRLTAYKDSRQQLELDKKKKLLSEKEKKSA